MILIRHLLARRRFAVLFVVVTLALKLLVPTGFMIAAVPGGAAIVPCSGMSGARDAMPDMAGMHTAMSAMHGDPTTPADDGAGDGAELPCAFAGLSAAALGAIDPVQIAALIAFVTALAWVIGPLPRLTAPAWLRPPLRGPPRHP